MSNLRKKTACLSSAFAGLMFATAAVAGGNGSGNEPPQSEKESAVSLCSIVPWVCVIYTSDGNGSGNEPPHSK